MPSVPRIINVASHCGLQPLPGFAAYSASKAGVLALTKALRLEHRRHGLGVVAFVPGNYPLKKTQGFYLYRRKIFLLHSRQ